MYARINPTILIIAVCTVAIATSCAPSADLPDTPELRLEKARVLAQQEREGGGFDETLDRGATFAFESVADALTLELERELAAGERDRVEAIMRAVIAEFLPVDAWENALVQVYAAHFSPAELQATIEFFSSPVGKKIIELQGTIDRQTGDAVDEIIGSRIEEFIQRIDDELAKEFPELAEEGS